MSRLVKYAKSGSFFGFDDRSLDEIYDLVRWAESDVPRLIPKLMNRLVLYLALYHQGQARKMSFGPYDPSGRNSAQAWRTPEQGIRRISQNYYLGWKVKSMGGAAWMIYNDSREAYFIEFGISQVGWGNNRHVPARRIRRPVNKLSGRRTIEWALRVDGMANHIWTEIYRGNGKYRFIQTVQSPAKGSFGGMFTLGRFLP